MGLGLVDLLYSQVLGYRTVKCVFAAHHPRFEHSFENNIRSVARYPYSPSHDHFAPLHPVPHEHQQHSTPSSETPLSPAIHAATSRRHHRPSAIAQPDNPNMAATIHTLTKCYHPERASAGAYHYTTPNRCSCEVNPSCLGPHNLAAPCTCVYSDVPHHQP